MIIKGRSPTMRHVSRTHRVALDWLFHRINLDSKIKFKYIDTIDQLADILSKGSFTRDEWNHLFCISHFSPTVCSAAMATRSQQDSGEERVTAKSRPMMNIIARTPPFVSSSTSVSPENIFRKRRILGSPLLQTIDQDNLMVQQIIQNWTTTVLGLLKNGKVRFRRTIDQGNEIEFLGDWYNKFVLITNRLFSTEPRNP